MVHSAQKEAVAYPTSSYERFVTYKNAKTDLIYTHVDMKPQQVITAIHSVGSDGNHGFRAIIFGMYGEQMSMGARQAKKMLAMYMQYKDTLYSAEKVAEMPQFHIQKSHKSVFICCPGSLKSI
ncbi:hypothetical protein PS15m_008783 [Mucor circinelloides]